jgi:M6 family metalloprotease-like protein
MPAPRLAPAAVAALLAAPFAGAAEKAPAPRPTVDLAGYRSVADLVRADPKAFKLDAPAAAAVPGYLGVELLDHAGKPTVEDVDSESPAAKAGLKPGDVVVAVGGRPVGTTAAARDALRGRADDALRLTVFRDGKAVELSATLVALSRPFRTAGERAVLGVQLDRPKDGPGAEITRVTPGGGADKAGVRTGDVIVRVNSTAIATDGTFADALADKRPGEVVRLLLRRGKDELELTATLGADAVDTGRGGRGGTGWDDRLPRAWTRPGYRLAILGIEYPDVKHNPKIADADWEASLFSAGTYTDKSATGQKAHGSMADYYREISYGRFKVEGKFAGWVEVSKKRMDYSTGSGTSVREKTGLLTEAMDKYLAKHGKDALKGYDGVFFLFAGGRVQTTRGSLYWPHRSSFRHDGRMWPYFIVQEGGDRMTDISVFCHEFGHMLGLPDLYARPEVPGMEGVGVWCAMSQQLPNGRPQHFSAWCKEQLGWVTPAVVDPRVRQKVVLAPIEDDPANCLKVPVRADGSEYLLLEVRKKKGFDTELPAEGLLVWRVLRSGGAQPVYLEEAHGVEGPTGPRLFPGAVPFPSPANRSFTPYTTPSSRSRLGGGFDVYLTDIRRLPDGRVAFRIGYEYQ